jgi:predicted nucleotidyltransferase/uncharacterized protein (UPF0332 family)
MIKTNPKNKVKEKTNLKRFSAKQIPTLQLKNERDIAMDFAQKVYTKFDKMVKAIILFGSSVKHTNVLGSDIDIIIVIDNATIKFDEKLVFWYREELGKIIQQNPYKKDLHINTVTLTTWWNDLTRGDPTLVNIIRYGEVLIDFGGFFSPLKALLEQGKIKPTPEAIYTCLNRVPNHIRLSKQAEISAIEGSYWAMVDTAQALLMTIRILPPSTEHIAILLKENFVDKNLLKIRYVTDFRDLHNLHRKVMHGEIKDIEGKIIDSWQDKSEDFFNAAMKIIEELI